MPAGNPTQRTAKLIGKALVRFGFIGALMKPLSLARWKGGRMETERVVMPGLVKNGLVVPQGPLRCRRTAAGRDRGHFTST